MITQEELKRILSYDKITGEFRWLITNSNRAKAGNIAGTTSHGYISIRIGKRGYLAHRLAWLYETGEWPRVIDHKNRIRSDNRLENLINGTQSGNQLNRGKMKNNTSGVKGVSWCKTNKKWRASTSVYKKYIHIGYFRNVDEAKAAVENFHNRIKVE